MAISGDFCFNMYNYVMALPTLPPASMAPSCPFHPRTENCEGQRNSSFPLQSHGPKKKKKAFGFPFGHPRLPFVVDKVESILWCSPTEDITPTIPLDHTISYTCIRDPAVQMLIGHRLFLQWSTKVLQLNVKKKKDALTETRFTTQLVRMSSFVIPETHMMPLSNK